MTNALSDISAPGPAGPGLFEARYLAFLETVKDLRPKLHKYCARMTGSVLDGEDVVQDALFQAYRKLDSFDDSRPRAPWLFRIAHNQCIDFLRRRDVRQRAEAEAAVPDVVEPVEASGLAVGRAIEHLVLALPPKERACVLLKDVFDYSLDEIAELVGSTAGGVKAALSRGRAKLATLPPRSTTSPASPHPETARLLSLYVDRFDRRDWEGLRELIAADARVRVADRYLGALADAPYFSQYRQRSYPWRAAMGVVDGAQVVVITRLQDASWTPQAIARVEFVGALVATITDYTHCPWVVASVGSLVVSGNDARIL
jgi:RNA polymerase sigma-70 factor (ECF subfamily)